MAAFKHFGLGQIVATRSVAETIPPTRLLEYLNLHAQGQWEHLCAEDAELNNLATQNGARILSCYPIDPAKPCKGENRLWCITDAEGDNGREFTTFLRPEEY